MTYINLQSPLFVAGLVFGFVAFMHILRLIYRIPIRIATVTIPMWVSVIAFLVALLLSVWMMNANSLPIHSSNKTFELKSTVLSEGSAIPARYTCQGDNISPPLNWKGEPSNTKSFALIVNDPDAPSGNWNHWIVLNIPAATHELMENVTSFPKGTLIGKNSFGKYAYGGPCPPSGEHHYYFTLYALDTILQSSKDLTLSQLEQDMHGHILATATLMSLYKK
jgi:hypothetical protein